MVRHLLTSYPVLIAGAALVAFCAARYDKIRAARSYLIGLPIMAVVLAGISAGSTTTEVRCPDDPSEFCVYNDSTPLLALFALLFFGACCVKSWLLYSER